MANYHFAKISPSGAVLLAGVCLFGSDWQVPYRTQMSFFGQWELRFLAIFLGAAAIIGKRPIKTWWGKLGRVLLILATVVTFAWWMIEMGLAPMFGGQYNVGGIGLLTKIAVRCLRPAAQDVGHAQGAGGQAGRAGAQWRKKQY